MGLLKKIKECFISEHRFSLTDRHLPERQGYSTYSYFLVNKQTKEELALGHSPVLSPEQIEKNNIVREKWGEGWEFVVRKD